ncbi:MAG: hypothetical protein WCX65_11010 [bacterium]
MKNIKTWKFFIAALILSAACVAASIPSRWQGARKAEEAYVPLRPMEAGEAAALLAYRDGYDPLRRYASVIKLDERTALVATPFYVLSGKGSGRAAVASVVFKGKTYNFMLANWIHRYNMHRIDRAALEKAIGSPLSQKDVDASAYRGKRSVFSSSLLWLYALIEILFFAFSATLLFYFFKTTKSIWLALPEIVLVEFIFIIFTRIYSPAFWDSDLFYERIAAEAVALRLFRTLPYLIPPAAASLALYILSAAQNDLKTKYKLSPGVFRTIAACLIIAACAAYIGGRHADYAREAAFAAGVSAKLNGSLNAGNIAALRSDPAFAVGGKAVYSKLSPGGAAKKAVDEILSDEYAKGGHALDVFIPAGRGHFIYLSRIPDSRYVDVRTLEYALDRAAVKRLLKSKQGYRTGFYAYLRAPFAAGGAVVADGGAAAVYLIKSEYGTPRTTFSDWVIHRVLDYF